MNAELNKKSRVSERNVRFKCKCDFMVGHSDRTRGRTPLKEGLGPDRRFYERGGGSWTVDFRLSMGMRGQLNDDRCGTHRKEVPLTVKDPSSLTLTGK